MPMVDILCLQEPTKPLWNPVVDCWEAREYAVRQTRLQIAFSKSSCERVLSTRVPTSKGKLFTLEEIFHAAERGDGLYARKNNWTAARPRLYCEVESR